MYSFYMQFSRIEIRDGDLSNSVECNDWKEVEVEDVIHGVNLPESVFTLTSFQNRFFSLSSGWV